MHLKLEHYLIITVWYLLIATLTKYRKHLLNRLLVECAINGILDSKGSLDFWSLSSPVENRFFSLSNTHTHTWSNYEKTFCKPNFRIKIKIKIENFWPFFLQNEHSILVSNSLVWKQFSVAKISLSLDVLLKFCQTKNRFLYQENKNILFLECCNWISSYSILS